MDIDVHLSLKLRVIMLSWIELDDMGCQMFSWLKMLYLFNVKHLK